MNKLDMETTWNHKMWPGQDTSISLNSSHSLPLWPTSSVLKCPSFRLCWLPQSPGTPLTLRVSTWFLSSLPNPHPCCSQWFSVTLPLKHSISCTHKSLLFFQNKKMSDFTCRSHAQRSAATPTCIASHCSRPKNTAPNTFTSLSPPSKTHSPYE